MSFVFKKIPSVLLPHLSLLFIDFFFFNLFLFFFLYLSGKVISHLFFLFLLLSFSPLFIFLFSFKLVFNMFHHFLILCSYLLFLIFDNRISKRGHNFFYFFLPLFFLLLSFFFQFILQSNILLLSLNILKSFSFCFLSDPSLIFFVFSHNLLKPLYLFLLSSSHLFLL